MICATPVTSSSRRKGRPTASSEILEAGGCSQAIDDLQALPARVQTIAALKGLGYSFRQIGNQFGITPQAVSLMLTRYRNALKCLDAGPELKGLSARAVNALGRLKVRTREEARAVDLLVTLKSERNCGVKTFLEIERWIAEGDAARKA